MWFKQAASSVWNATKNIISDNRTPAKRLLDDIIDSKEEIIPTNKLNQLSALTFDLQSFQQIVDIAIDRIRVFKYDLDQARKNLNMLITINYLIKHGAGAFVDQLRGFIATFKKYQALEELKTYEDELMQSKLIYELQKIKSRAQHIQTLLQDKQKLLKEKELSMLIKQKLKLYQKEKLQDIKYPSRNSPNKSQNKPNVQSNASQQSQQQRMGKLQWMMEKYLWKYVDKIDGKLQEVSDKVLQQVDKYVLGQTPDKFELEDDEQHEEDKFDSYNKEQVHMKDQKQDQLLKRLEQEGDINTNNHNSNLLQFEQVIEEQVKIPNKIQHEDLI